MGFTAEFEVVDSLSFQQAFLPPSSSIPLLTAPEPVNIPQYYIRNNIEGIESKIRVKKADEKMASFVSGLEKAFKSAAESNWKLNLPFRRFNIVGYKLKQAIEPLLSEEEWKKLSIPNF